MVGLAGTCDVTMGRVALWGPIEGLQETAVSCLFIRNESVPNPVPGTGASMSQGTEPQPLSNSWQYYPIVWMRR